MRKNTEIPENKDLPVVDTSVDSMPEVDLPGIPENSNLPEMPVKKETKAPEKKKYFVPELGTTIEQ